MRENLSFRHRKGQTSIKIGDSRLNTQVIDDTEMFMISKTKRNQEEKSKKLDNKRFQDGADEYDSWDSDFD